MFVYFCLLFAAVAANSIFALPGNECGPTIFDSFLALCLNEGFTPNISHNASQLNSVLRLVESGFGVAIMPAGTEKGDDLNLKFIAIENAEETVPLIMLIRKENPDPALLHLKNHFTALRQPK